MATYFFNLLNNSQPENQPSPAETVEKYIDRVKSSSLLEDRRGACRSLRACSKKYRVEVGAQGLETLLEVLEVVQDSETASHVLEILCNVTYSGVFEEETPNAFNVGEQFTEIFLKKKENVATIINLLDDYDFHVRLPAIRLIINLLSNKPKDMQEIVLESELGVSKLMDILSDSRDFVRNEALICLTQLTKSNANIQKIVAFNNGFEQLFQVIRHEGFSDGGIVVDDCLQFMLNLLKGNLSNQTFFREGTYIKHITPFFQMCLQPEDETSDGGWSPQKVANVHSMFRVVRTLVSPANASQMVAPTQKAMASCGLLSELCRLLMAGGVPADILSETICTVAEIIRGCQANQEFFMQVMAPSSPSRTALVVLLMSMVNDKQPLSLRTAVLYCLQCYLYKNETGQMQIVQALLPTSAEALATITPGQLLCMGLFTTDPLSHWLSSVSLSHALVNNVSNKDLLLRVHLATSQGAPPISLLQQGFSILQMGGKVQSRLGILILLSTWLANCPNAVAQFLRLPNSVAFLIAQVGSNEHDELEVVVPSLCAFLLGLCVLFNNDSNTSFTKESLCQLIAKRIGVETFMDKLAEASKHEMYSRALKHPQINIGSPEDVQLDHEFCRLYKTLESQIVKAIAPSSVGGTKGAESPSEAELSAVAKYKEMIREQDDQIQHLRQRLAALDAQYITAQSQIEELNSTVQHLQDQNALLKAQRNNNVQIDEPSSEGTLPPSKGLEQLEMELQQLKLDNDRLRSQVEEKEKQILSMNGDDHNPDLVRSSLTNTCSNSILDSFQITTPAKHEEFQVCSIFRPETNTNQATHLEAELKALRQELESQKNKNESEAASLKVQLNGIRQQNLELTEELERSKKDQEDLLILLADQDSKIKNYKQMLKARGEQVSEDEDGDDDIGDSDNSGDLDSSSEDADLC